MSRSWISILAIAVLACGGKSDIEQRYAKAVGAQRAATGAPADELLSIGKSGNDVVVAWVEHGTRHDMLGNANGSDRKYSIDGGAQVLNTTDRSYGFKVRDPNKNVRWKVRLYPDKIKISDNDDDKNPVRIRTEAPDRAELKDDKETLLGTIGYAGGKTVVTDAAGKVRFTRPTDKLEPSYGVWLIDKMPLTEKFVVVGELMARGR